MEKMTKDQRIKQLERQLEEAERWKDEVEFPPLGDAAVTRQNNPEFYRDWEKGKMEEFKNIPIEGVVKVVFYSDSQDPTHEANRAVVVYDDHRILLLKLAYPAEMNSAYVVTYADTVWTEDTTKEEIEELKV